MTISMFLGALAAVATTVATFSRRPMSGRGDTRTYDDYIGDIRAMNSYNSYFVGALAIVIGLVVEGSRLADSVLILLFVAFSCGASALFFFPIKKPTPDASLRGVRAFWLSKVLFSQWTAVFSVAAIGDLILDEVG